MKWTTANLKNPNYTGNHEIYVGTQTGTFKKLMPAYERDPFAQTNLQDLSKLNKDSRITALAFGNVENSEILLGHGHNTVELHSLRSEQVERSFNVVASPVVGVARYEDYIIAGCANGKVQRITIKEDQEDEEEEDNDKTNDLHMTAGDDMAHLRQCAVQRNLVATGGKGRQNNLKVFDVATGGKPIFSSKNLPNDFLQLEVPVWDSDVGFMDAPHTLATCSRHGYVRVYDTRKQRRPVQCFATDDPLCFATLTTHGNYIYTGTTMGALKAFDVRRMKTFVHTYKGFTGSLTDLHLDGTGKFLTSTCLDRYVRVHHADSCVLLYQCYVKSKALRVLIRDSLENPNTKENDNEDDEETIQNKVTKKTKSKHANSDDEEYDEIFEQMQTVCEKAEDEDDDAELIDMAKAEDEQADDAELIDTEKDEDVDEADDAELTDTEIVTEAKTKQATKRKLDTKIGTKKIKKN